MPMTAAGIPKAIEEIGELQVELGKLVQLLGKKLAYYHTDEHPDGAGSLKTRIEEESADVMASIIFVLTKLRYDTDFVDQRVDAKIRRFAEWENDPNNNQYGVDRVQ